MQINDLFNVLTDDARVTIYDASGARIIANACKDEVPEFMLEWNARDIAPLDNGFSIVIDNETYLQAFSIMRELVNELDDLEDCSSQKQVDAMTVDRLRTISRTAHSLAYNIRNGKPWRAGLFTAINSGCTRRRY